MKHLLSITICGLFITCTNPSPPKTSKNETQPQNVILIDEILFNDLEQYKPFGFIYNCTNITLKQTNAKCGEWGGDTEIIRFYLKDCKGDTLVDYTKQVQDCSYHSGRKVKQTTTSELVITKNVLRMLEQAILDLSRHKLHVRDHFFHAGISNQITFSDSSLILNDWSFYSWKSFQTLRDEITKIAQ